jgi:glycosyltransferase involved in cell wall biosynthesis
MNILVVNWLDRENPQAGGAEEHLHQTFGRLASKGHSVTLLSSGFRDCAARTELDGIDVHRAGSRYTFSLAAPRYFAFHFADRPFDVVVEDVNKVPLFTPHWTRTPVALLVHHLFGATAFLEASFPLAAATWILERPIPRVFHGVPTVAVSESTKADLLRRGLRTEIEVIPNGIDLTAYAPSPDHPKTADPTLLFLGRVKKYKRVDLLLRAVARLKSDGLVVRFRVAGAGDARADLERLATELNIVDQVEFLGFVDDALKLELLRTSWVHGLTSPKEGWGISNLEAAACGTPSVSSDSPGLRESVRDGETGLLTPHGDVAALAGAIRVIVTDPELRARLGDHARSFAGSYSWDSSAEAIGAFLERVVARSDPG